ncbi:MAG: polyprenyl synthetase family protein, partial [Candidatus Atribacteria bacterium]|nr:polyprenyl synthetase family protein [Candidatus Atribacteria bacterium]MCD6349269.1 polyprenyl synthetase family protein [Candidatus Atribacteria bacterium]
KAMRYGTIGGGKKVRASLLFASGEVFGVEREKLLPLAAGIEMIHSFSLIHDDLPCMDNDDYRRGKLSMHCAFGEAMAVLVGDALLIEGLRVFSTDRHFLEEFGKEKLWEVLVVLFEALGVSGMLSGQVLDIQKEGKPVGRSVVEQIMVMKTARFIQAAVLCGAILGGAKAEERSFLAEFGLLLGKCFQLKDDLLDVTGSRDKLGKTAGKDLVQGKATLLRVVGFEEAEKQLKNWYEEALDVLARIKRPVDCLRDIARFVVEREH